MPGHLLGQTRTELQFNPASLRHQLVVRQFPLEARASGSVKKSLERRTLDPMPAVELMLFQQLDDETEKRELTGYALFAELIDPESGNKIEYLRDGATEVLCGVSISSLYRGPDETLFFPFPNLGVRATGRFRIRFTLSCFGRLDCSNLTVCSPPFKMLTASKYRGTSNATELTLALAKNGALARVRKNARGARPNHRSSEGLRGDDPLSTDVSTVDLAPDRIRSTKPEPSPSKMPMVFSPPPQLLTLHAPKPRYPSHGEVVAALLTNTMEHVHSPCLDAAGSPFSPMEASEIGEVGFTEDVWATQQPHVFDTFLADWYSDCMHMVVDDEAYLWQPGE
ncbi:velvet factor-domain-containing protein [Mycena sanguinolenta]|nr:velvet factor-domain-containing protein [Mycena sanguinolenta]